MSPRNNPSRAQVARSRDERQLIAAQLTVSSALPPASELERYTVLHPEMPDRLMTAWEKQGDHRRSVENKWVGGEVWRANFITIGSWVMIMTLMLGSFYLILNGHEGIGVAGIIGDIVLLVASYLGRRLGGRNQGG